SVVCVPYFVIAYVFTGNPFFPMLNGIFSKGSFSAAANLVADPRYSLDSSLLAPLRLPVVLTFAAQRLATTQGGVGALLLLLPLALLLFFVRRAQVRLLFAISVGYLILLSYTVRFARYYMPILPIVVVLITA